MIKSRYLAIRKIKVSQIYSVPRYSFIGRGQKWVWVESVRQYLSLAYSKCTPFQLQKTERLLDQADELKILLTDRRW